MKTTERHTPDQFLEIIIPAARTMFENDGALASCAFCGTYELGVIHIVDMTSTDEIDKRAHVLALRSFNKLFKVDWCIFLAEAWTIARTTMPEIAPSKAPDREEVMFALVNEKGQTTRSGFAPIDRSGSRPTFGIIKWMDGAQAGQLTDLLG